MLNTLLKLNLLKLFLLAILLRVLIMPFYFHPDIKTYHFQAAFLKKGIFNIYTHLVNNKETLPIKEEFVYFPLTFFFLGTYQILAAPLLGPNFNDWLSDASEQARESVGTFRYLFILKLPYLVIDLTVAFLIMKFFDDVNRKKKALILWLFNPFSIAIIYIFSNIDIIPVALSLLCLLFFRNKKIFLSGLTLGLAAGFKAYPLLFLPFLMLYTKDVKEALKMFITSVGILVLIILPFWSSAFLNSAFISGLTTRIAFPTLAIGFGESLMIALISLSSLFVMGLTEAGKKLEFIQLYILQVLLLLFSGIHFHIQWLLWIMPFLTIFYVYKKDILGKLVWIWTGLAFAVPLLYDDKFMSISLLSAISAFYNLLPTPFLIIQKIYDPFLIQGLIHSIIFGIGLVLIFRTWRLLKI